MPNNNKHLPPKKMQQHKIFLHPEFEKQMGLNTVFETPENKSIDEHVVHVWTETYITLIACGESRNTTRMKADEAVEDFLEAFTNG